ncbi:ABC transporter substrate-binding protein [Streptomyces radiopugnans]|uniref:Multiple sugar transport system substrate-binding protein n=1 Tax=Streptomyces radiopugnans TaxID=403935 RepID=A0A1H9BQA1_9ACTN|nr:ABC transporter substrate-binding protein [Streptomyces radiopugnans]SEP90703.1 multiple sugar transport system substrate-binding protein [Streptomyces radiopugnans]
MSSASPYGTNMRRRSFLGAAGALAGTGLLTACGGGTKLGADDSGPDEAPEFDGGEYDGPKVTLQYWNGFTGGDGPHMRAMLKAFNKEYAGRIEVRNTTRQWQDLYPAMPTAITAGKGPDVAVIHNDWVATFAARRTLVPLDDVVSALELTESDFIPAVWQAGIYGGKRYSIPLDVHCLADYANARHLSRAGLDAPPTDRSGYEDALAELRDAGIKNPFWMPNKWPAHLMFMSLLWQFGGELYDAEGTAALWGSDAGVEALSWMREQITKGHSPAQVAQDAQYNAFKNNKVSFTWDGIWQINDLKANARDLRWEMAQIPTIGDTPAAWSASHNFVLTSQAAKDGNKVRAAKFFIDHMSKRSTEWAKAGMIPARNSARKDPEVAGLPQIALAKDVEVFHFLPALPGIGDVQSKALELAVQKAVLGQLPPAKALAEGVRTADKLLAENKQKYAK